MFEAWVLYRARAEDLTQLVQPYFFANVKLNENEDGPAQRRFDDHPRLVDGFGQVKKDFRVQSHKAYLPPGRLEGWNVPAAGNTIVPEFRQVGESRMDYLLSNLL
jgi:hypothetical protein